MKDSDALIPRSSPCTGLLGCHTLPDDMGAKQGYLRIYLAHPDFSQLPHVPKEYMWGSYSTMTVYGPQTIVPGRPPAENF